MARICKLRNIDGELLYTRNVTDAIVDTGVRRVLTESLDDVRRRIGIVELKLGDGFESISNAEIDEIINNKNRSIK